MDNELDRISNLPEPLLHHILSFLETKHVVQTSVLSRRWRYVWKTVSTLVFRVNTYSHDGFIEMNNFTWFIDKVLLLRDRMSDIEKFHLQLELMDIDQELLKDRLNTWILVALSRNVQELVINIDTGGGGDTMEINFPHCLFNSQSLRKLVLGMTGKVESCVFLPNSMDLPRLKFLSLTSFHTKDVDFISKLISSCPVLESLVLEDIWIENDDDVKVIIESRELKHLEIISDREDCGPQFDLAKSIKLSTPNLISFFCSAFMVQEYCLENLSSLVTATIEMTKEGSSSPLEVGHLSVEEKHKVYPKRMMEFLRGFHNVKELTVSSPDFIQVLGGSPVLLEVQSSPQFYNLRCLNLDTSFTRCCIRAMIYLLKTCPSVEYLFLTRYESGLLNASDDGELGLSLPCLMSHLKHLEIRRVQCCENELKFLEFLLKNAVALEKMVVSFNARGSPDTTGSADRRKLIKKFKEKLRTLPRASPSLMIVFP